MSKPVTTGSDKRKAVDRLNKNVELLDTPGILWPRFEDQAVGLKLALSDQSKMRSFRQKNLRQNL